jgi:hypothetical protein
LVIGDKASDEPGPTFFGEMDTIGVVDGVWEGWENDNSGDMRLVKDVVEQQQKGVIPSGVPEWYLTNHGRHDHDL